MALKPLLREVPLGVRKRLKADPLREMPKVFLLTVCVYDLWRFSKHFPVRPQQTYLKVQSLNLPLSRHKLYTLLSVFFISIKVRITPLFLRGYAL